MFWLIATGIVVLVMIPIARILLQANQPIARSAEQDVSIYKDQLAEVDRDLARGVLNNSEAESARTEVARRLLAANKRVEIDSTITGVGRSGAWFAIALIAVLVLGSIGIYTQMGVPGMPDMPLQARLDAAKQERENRPDQTAAEAAAPAVEVQTDPQHLALVEKLREAVKANPNDETGLRLLVNNEARLGNLVAARVAQQHLMTVLGDRVKASDHTDQAEIMILAAGGYVSPQAENALARALKGDPRDPRARYYSGLALAQTGRPDVAYRMWAGLLEEGPEDAPWIPLIRAQITPVARAAGIALGDPTAPGPTAQDVESANEMSTEDRKEMIRGMVAGLADRLATEGGTPAEWARLIRAYGVLGETANANAIWQEAQSVFAENPEAMSLLHEAAQAAEVAQ